MLVGLHRHQILITSIVKFSKYFSKEMVTPSQNVHDVPMDVIIRPIPPVLDEDKVASLMETLKEPNGEGRLPIPPIDIMWIVGREGGHYFYSFGGCHRFEAHKRLKLPTIKGNLIESSVRDLICYLGASTPDLK